MKKSYKYRIYPNKEQREKISQFFGCSRKMYNLLLDWWISAYKEYKTNGTPIGSLPQPTFYKKQEEYSYLKDCDAVALATARINLNRALDNYLKSKKGKRKGKKVQFPTFKKKGKCRDSYGTFNNSDCIKVTDGHISLPKLGMVKIVLHRPYEGTIKSVHVSCTKSMHYYVSLTCEASDEATVNNVSHINNLNVVGLDMSISQFVVSSNKDDNTKTKYVRLFRKNEKRLARLGRNLSKKKFIDKRPSNNRLKAQLRYAKLSEHISNQRKDYCIKEAVYYATHYDVIVLEDLDMQSMSRSLHLGKSVNDLGFGMFKSWLSHECKKHDSIIMFADKYFASSKTCFECGVKNDLLKLSDREWVCPHCGAIIDRDYNAALNLRDYFYKVIHNTVGTTEIKACGETTSTLRETLMQVVSMKQEAPSFRLE